MLVHIGNGYLVLDKDIVGIFDLDGKITPRVTTDFLKKAQKDGKCVSSHDELPRSFVLSSNKKEEKIILSHISSHALYGRCRRDS